jgi:type II secretion system protein G
MKKRNFKRNSFHPDRSRGRDHHPGHARLDRHADLPQLREEGQRRRRHHPIKLLEDALTGYKLDIGSYPESLGALVSNVDQSEKWDGPYIKPAVPKDPWGNAYVYTFPGEHGDFDLVCYGADGQPGGTGENADITNYVENQKHMRRRGFTLLELWW